MVPKASPSAPPTKKRIWTSLHHWASSACAGKVEMAAASAVAAATTVERRSVVLIAMLMHVPPIVSLASRGTFEIRFGSAPHACWPAPPAGPVSRRVRQISRASPALFEVVQRLLLPGDFEI